MANAYRDQNNVPTLIAVSSADGQTPVRLYADPTTHRLLTDSASASGTVTSVSVVTANGFAGTVANATTTPAITLTTTVTGILSGNGTAISAASTTGTGAVVLANSPTFIDDITIGGAAVATGSILMKGTTSGTVTIKVADVAGTWSLTLPTTDGNSGEFLQTDGAGVTTWAAGSSGITIGTTTITGGTDTKVLYDNAGVVGEYTISGSGNVAMTTSPSFTTPTLGVASATTINKVTITAPATGSTLTIADGKTLTASDTTTLATNSITFAGTEVLTLAATKSVTFADAFITSGANSLTLTTTAPTNVTLPTSGTLATTTYVPTAITVANEGTDTTCFPVFVTAATGDLGPKTNASLTYNSNTGAFGLGTSAALTTGTIELGAASDTTIARVSAGVISVENVTILTVAGGTLTGAINLGENAGLVYDAALSADGKYSGSVRAGTAGTTLAFGDLVYLAAADSRWELTDANAASTAGDVLIGMCVLAAAADGDPTTILLQGFIRADTAFPAMTISAPQYISETAGDITGTQPTTTDAVIRRVGFAWTADELYFNPSNDYITHT